ncbi:unnamed protein product [Parascedosporium putredinis]|nr:unnamed protein product [Parascedosporium putredinis]CAI7993311.1 unnamed protein product [Parascedosporium putredinis]
MRFDLLLPLGIALAPIVAAQDSLKIDIVNRLSCAKKTKVGDNIAVNYNGTLTDGTPFDSSYSEDGSSPFTFPLGIGMVIRGWDLGLLDMCVGEQRILTIGPGLAYGNEAVGPIPAGSTLVFETELMEIIEEEEASDE